MSTKSSQRQQQILRFVESYLIDHGIPPTQKEIARHCGLVSTSSISKHLDALEHQGWLRRKRRIPRSITLLRNGFGKINSSEPLHEIPLKGKVAAGRPIEYKLENEYRSLPAGLVRHPDKSYLLEVVGTSMIEEAIQHGDYVIVEYRDYAYDGEVVIAMINYEEATVKRFYQEKNRIRLQPANFEASPIFVEPEKFSIHGVVVGVMRSY